MKTYLCSFLVCMTISVSVVAQEPSSPPKLDEKDLAPQDKQDDLPPPSVPPEAAPDITPIIPEEPAAQPKPPAATPAAQKGPHLLGTQLRIPGPKGTIAIELGCTGKSAVIADQTAYIACGGDGVIVLELKPTPRVLARYPIEGSANRVFAHEGQIMVDLERNETVPVTSMGNTRPGPNATPYPQDYAAEVMGKVTKLNKNNSVVINIGTEDGLVDDTRIEFTKDSESSRILAVGYVSSLEESSAVIALGMGERISKGMIARPSRRPLSRSLMLPEVPRGLEVSLGVRPFIPLNTSGFALLVDSTMTYRFKKPWFVRADIGPIGFGAGESQDRGTIGVLNVGAIGGYSQGVLELGIGVGVANLSLADEADDGSGSSSIGSGVGLALYQYGLFGSRDGFYVELKSTLVYGKRFHFGQFDFKVQIPLGRHTWLVNKISGGRLLNIYGELGIRRLVRGDGRSGSIFVTAAVGGGSVRKVVFTGSSSFRGQTDNVGYTGPSVSITLERRF